VVLSGLLGGVGDLAVVDDQDVAVGAALLISPADGLGELGLGVGEEKLENVSGPSFSSSFLDCFGGCGGLTMSSPVTPLALPQALMT
jgi:hypothetical protein